MGFKFSPVIGEILADLTEAGRSSYDLSCFGSSKFTSAGRPGAGGGGCAVTFRMKEKTGPLSLLPLGIFLGTYQRHSAHPFRSFEPPAGLTFTLDGYVRLRVSPAHQATSPAPQISVETASGD